MNFIKITTYFNQNGKIYKLLQNKKATKKGKQLLFSLLIVCKN